MSQVLVAELALGASAMFKMIPPHLGRNNRLFDNLALYFFISSVIYIILQPLAHLVSSVSYSKNLL
jgi:hypothetical protein